MIISKNHFELVNTDNILRIGTKANEAKKHYDDVINGTIGMMFDNEGHLADFKLVDDIISVSNNEKTKKYGPVGGSEGFKKAVIKWLFPRVDLNNVYTDAISTIGATGALSVSMRNYVDSTQDVIIPSIRWSSYDNIAAQCGLAVKEYNLFKEDKLDIESIKAVVDESIKKTKRAYLIINDPCHNPTGYSLSLDEWKEILDYLKLKSNEGQIVLLDDIAYMNFSDADYSKVFDLMTQYINSNFMVQIAFSAAKTLSIYGIRGGALVALCKNKEEIECFDKACVMTIRAIWSRPNNVACDIIEQAFLDDENNTNIRLKLDDYRSILNERAHEFFKYAKKYNLKTQPYRNGFFVLLKCNNNEDVCNKLMEKHIYLVPMSEGLRISLAAIALKDIKRVVEELNNVINKTEA